MGCSCNKKAIKNTSSQVKRQTVRPTRVVHKPTSGSKTLRRVLERY